MKAKVILRKSYRKLIDNIYPKAVILMYHRVVDLPNYIYPITVSPKNFQQHMKYLREAFRPVELEELAFFVEQKTIPRRAVVVTFDDGYADNYLNALTILEDYKVPATIFISSGYINGKKEYWWDDLERIFLSSGAVPDILNLSIGNVEYEWSLETLEQRRAVRAEFRNLLKPLKPEERESLLGSLIMWSGVGYEGREIHRSMTREELVHLSKSQYIQIGGHTVNHPQLAALPKELQFQEIKMGCDNLSEITGYPVNTFSYPFGENEDYTPESADILHSIGIKAACTTQSARVLPGDDLLRLPRFAIGDWELDIFKTQLDSFFDG